jgi:ribosomal protein L14E/L6E/L27E
MPILDNLSSKNTPEPEVVKETTSQPDEVLIPNTQGKIEKYIETEEVVETVKDDSHEELLTQYKDQKKLAETNHEELKNRTGKADNLPKLSINTDTNKKSMDSAIQELRSYTSKTNTDIAQLNARVTDRQKMAINGDLIRIFLSEATITEKENTFRAQPLVGLWVRGETRVIRLKDSILFENPKSEDLKITFSETYQLIVNEQVIGTINPNKEKNSASFSVSTQNGIGKIVGKLDYRIESDK